jgi:hypothetical protein
VPWSHAQIGVNLALLIGFLIGYGCGKV